MDITACVEENQQNSKYEPVPPAAASAEILMGLPDGEYPAEVVQATAEEDGAIEAKRQAIRFDFELRIADGEHAGRLVRKAFRCVLERGREGSGDWPEFFEFRAVFAANPRTFAKPGFAQNYQRRPGLVTIEGGKVVRCRVLEQTAASVLTEDRRIASAAASLASGLADGWYVVTVDTVSTAARLADDGTQFWDVGFTLKICDGQSIGRYVFRSFAIENSNAASTELRGDWREYRELAQVFAERPESFVPGSLRDNYDSRRPGRVYYAQGAIHHYSRLDDAEMRRIAPEYMAETSAAVTVQPPIKPVVEHIPDCALRLPGILGDITEWVTDSAFSPQPLLSPLAALAFCATVLGNDWCGPTRLAANLYQAGIATTGGGKDHILRTPQVLLQACGLGARVGGSSIASGAGVISRLIDQPNTAWLLDEWGHYLRAMADPRTGGHLREVATYLLQLSGPLHPVFGGKDYADRKARATQSVAYPCVNLLGVTTPDVYFETLTTDQIRDGFLGRMIVAETTVKPKKNRNAKPLEPLQGAIDWAGHVGRHAATSPNRIVVPSAPRVVEYNCDATRRFMDEFDDFADREYSRLEHEGQGLQHLVVRWREQALKLALVAAAAIDPIEPRITLAAAEWAAGFVRFHGQRAIRTIGDRVTASEFERTLREFLIAIRRAGANGLTLSEMSHSARVFRRPSRERGEYLSRLEEDGTIIRKNIGSRDVRVAAEFA
jgi:hypothetical protein